MSRSNLSKLAQVEAFLFYHGEPVLVKKISQVLGFSEDDVVSLLDDLERNSGDDMERGVCVLRKDGKVQLVAKSEFGFVFEGLVRDDLKETLTPAALEVLSIIAYLGPITRVEVDYVRGVNSSFILRNLSLRSLIEKRDEKGKGGAYKYVVSLDFLKHVGLKKVEKLPEYDKYGDLLERFRKGEERALG